MLDYKGVRGVSKVAENMCEFLWQTLSHKFDIYI